MTRRNLVGKKKGRVPEKKKAVQELDDKIRPAKKLVCDGVPARYLACLKGMEGYLGPSQSTSKQGTQQQQGASTYFFVARPRLL